MREKDILPITSPDEAILDIISVISSTVPWIGGTISLVLSTESFERKVNRIKEVLFDMTDQIKEINSVISKNYVKTEDFQEILETVLTKVYKERNQHKRKAFANFLVNDIKNPSFTSYDEKMRFTAVLENMQYDHIRMLLALNQNPDYSNIGLIGSLIHTLQKRLPDLSSDTITELAQQLTDMRVAKLDGLFITITARGAEELQELITPFGQRFLKYILIE